MDEDVVHQAEAVISGEAAGIRRAALMHLAELLYLLEETTEDQAIGFRIAAALMPIAPEARQGLGPA